MKGQTLIERNLRICLIGTYPPRECGIGTFTYDLQHSLNGIHSSVVSLSNEHSRYKYPAEVAFEIRQHNLSDYDLAAEYINSSGVELLCLQHEFGIFGGPDGVFINELLRRVTVPVVTTLHTVLRNPSDGIRETLIRVAEKSDRLVVLNSRAIPILKSVYGVPGEKVSLIHHGVPDVPFIDPNFYKDKFAAEGRLVVLTFGLLNRNKGIEVMIDALPEIVKRHPRVLYLVLGATHPEVRRHQGEEYRDFLKQKVQQLGLEDNVIFDERYVSFPELCEFIGAADIYVTPYQSAEQIVSGTLAYALGMGKAIVSTPYLYAEELLSDNRGKLVDFGDSSGLSQTINQLIQNPAERHRMRKQAYQFGRQMIWREVGEQYSKLLEEVAIASPRKISVSIDRSVSSFELPVPKLDYLIHLTDNTGVIQHAAYGIPDWRSGYSTDDVGRALVVAVKYYDRFRDPVSVALAEKYVSFLLLAQKEDGRFHNFMNYRREFVDELGSEDTQGRALWGLGAAVAYGPTTGIRSLAREMFERAIHNLKLRHPRALAYAICGAYEFLQRYNGAAQVRRKMEKFSARLYKIFERSKHDDWKWFGNELTYANAKMPHAMLLAAQVTGEQRYLDTGLESLEFLLSQTYREGIFDFPGNKGWQHRQGRRAIFGQQPIEAGYMAEALMTAAAMTGQRRYEELAMVAFQWLLGLNRLGVELYDPLNGACSDGLDARGANMNQGAESTICCLIGLDALPNRTEARLELSSRLVTQTALISDVRDGQVTRSRGSAERRYGIEKSVPRTFSPLRTQSDPDSEPLAVSG